MIDLDCVIDESAVVYDPTLCNLYGCWIDAGSTIGPFVEIQRGSVVGKFSKICSHTFICGGVEIGDRVFVGHGVMFVNDLYPLLSRPSELETTTIEDDVSIGSGSTILPVRVGQGAIIGAGTVVTKNVPPWSIIVGVPGRVVRQFSDLDERDAFVQRHGVDAGSR